MNIAALLGTSGTLPEQLGKVVSASADPAGFKQLLQNMTMGEGAQDAVVSVSNIEASAAAPPGLDLLGTLFKLFDKGSGPISTLDPTGEASDTDQDEIKASLTELMAALQPLVGQSAVTLAAGNVALQPHQPAQPTTTTTSQPVQSQYLPAVNVADKINIPADIYTPSSATTSQPQPSSTSNTVSQPQPPAGALAQQATAASAAISTTTPVPTSTATETTSISYAASQPGPPISTTTTTTTTAATAHAAAQPATGAPAAGATNALNRPDSPISAGNTTYSTAQSVNGAPARVTHTDFAQALNNEATAPSVALNGANRPVPVEQPSAMAAATTATATAAGQMPAVDSGQQQPAFTVSSRQPQPEQQTVAASSAPVAPTADPSAGVTQTGPTAAPEMPKLPVLQQVTDSVKLMVQQGDTEVRMQLHPRVLGELHIQLHMTQEGTVAVRMLAETGQAQSLLHEHLPQLKAAFAAQGMQVTQMNVDVGSDSSAFYHQARHSGQNPFAGAQHTPTNRGYADDSTSTRTAVQNQAKPGGLNAIDFRA